MGKGRIELAEFVATAAHAGQTRQFGEEAGAPYIDHPRRVAESVARMGADSFSVQAAWLHDVIEDTDLTAGDLTRLGFNRSVVLTVVALSRLEGESYADFIERLVLGSDVRAKLVKMADLTDNLRTLPEGHSLRKRYKAAFTALRDSL